MRYAETDQMGIVHHSTYLVWLEEGRSHFMRTHGTSFTAFEKEGVSLAVSELHVRYSHPARYDQLVTIRCWIDEVRSRKVTFGYQVIDSQDGVELASGSTRHICVDRQGKVAKIPAHWRQMMEKFINHNPTNQGT